MSDFMTDEQVVFLGDQFPKLREVMDAFTNVLVYFDDYLVGGSGENYI